MNKPHFIKYLNLTLVVAFPIAWFSPLLTTGLLPPLHLPVWLGGNTLFEPTTLTVISGIQKLLKTDILLRHGAYSFQSADGRCATGDNDAGQARHG
jgi:hypothetical protein